MHFFCYKKKGPATWQVMMWHIQKWWCDIYKKRTCNVTSDDVTYKKMMMWHIQKKGPATWLAAAAGSASALSTESICHIIICIRHIIACTSASALSTERERARTREKEKRERERARKREKERERGERERREREERERGGREGKRERKREGEREK